MRGLISKDDSPGRDIMINTFLYPDSITYLIVKLCVLFLAVVLYLMLTATPDPFDELNITVMGENLRVEIDRDRCHEMPLVVIMHDSSQGNVWDGKH